TYAPNASALNATYTPSAAEIAAGGVTLTLTTNDPSGPCGTVSNSMYITISPAATVNAGADATVCSSSPQVQLAGAIGGGASSGRWSGGTGSYNPSATTPNAKYTPSAAEIAAGSVTLTLTSDAVSGPCGQVSDQVTITISPAATVNAGIDRIACSTSPAVQLAGLVGGGANTGTWTGGTGGFNPGPTRLDAIYTPSAAEIAAGSVTLTLTTNDPIGPCDALSDQMKITISPIAIVNAGSDVNVCASSPVAQLGGSVSGGASSGTWSGGAGSYNPSASTLNAKYTPTAADIAAGSVTLTLTTNDPAGPCGPLSDQVKLTLDQPAVSVADRSLCAGMPPVQVCANVTRGVSPYTYRWSNGATTSCIAVADPGPYTVTITDAIGCQATGT